MFVRFSALQRSLQPNCFDSKQKELDADSRAMQHIEFDGVLKTNSEICTVLKKIKTNNTTIL